MEVLLGKKYKSIALVRVSEVENIPVIDKQQYQQHKQTKSARKISAANKQAGVDENNITTSKRESKKKSRLTEEESEEELEYEVEEIVDEGIAPSRKKIYRMHWRGYPSDQDTWQPLKDIKHLDAYKIWKAAREKK